MKNFFLAAEKIRISNFVFILYSFDRRETQEETARIICSATASEMYEIHNQISCKRMQLVKETLTNHHPTISEMNKQNTMQKSKIRVLTLTNNI